jgi:hypothetical protein
MPRCAFLYVLQQLIHLCGLRAQVLALCSHKDFELATLLLQRVQAALTRAILALTL